MWTAKPVMLSKSREQLDDIACLRSGLKVLGVWRQQQQGCSLEQKREGLRLLRA
jgi:hypothetical protein